MASPTLRWFHYLQEVIGITQTEFCHMMGLSYPQYWKAVRGENAPPVILKVCERLNQDPVKAFEACDCLAEGLRLLLHSNAEYLEPLHLYAQMSPTERELWMEAAELILQKRRS